MAAALIGRLGHHRHVVKIRGNSFRMREHRELWRTLQEDYEEKASPAAKRARTPREATRR